MPGTNTAPINLTIRLDVPYDEYVARINESVYKEIEEKSAEIRDQIRVYVNDLVTSELENKVIREVNILVSKIVRDVINTSTVEKAAKTALRKATQEAVAKAIGQE